MVLLLANFAIPFQRLPPGEWPAASWIDTLISAIFYGHLGLCLCALVCVFKFGYTSQFRAAILLAAFGSIPLMTMGVLCVTMSKTGKWL
jgi:hypothetical protein